MAGRPPKPTALKRLTGNPGGRPLPENEPTPPPGEIQKPDYLREDAHEHWDRLAPIGIAMGTLTVADADMFATLCHTIADIALLEAGILEEGRTQLTDKGTVLPHPYVSQLKAARTEMRQLSAKFGLTASDRAKLAVSMPKQEKDESPTPALGKLKAI